MTNRNRHRMNFQRDEGVGVLEETARAGRMAWNQLTLSQEEKKGSVGLVLQWVCLKMLGIFPMQ